MASIFFMYWLGFYMLFLLKMESVLVTPSSLYSFYDGVLLILGRRADVFLGFGTAGRLLVLRGFSITFISCLALPTDLVLPIIYFLDSILNTWIPRPNMSWGTLSSLSILCGGLLGFMAGALLNIDGKFIIIKHAYMNRMVMNKWRWIWEIRLGGQEDRK